MEVNKAFEGDNYIKDELIKLRDKFGLTSCIETGTQFGSTTLELCSIFDNVTTIEADENYYNIACDRLSNDNVTLVFGKSQDVLKVIQKPENVLYYLDAHGSGECPLKDELKIITKFKNICIAIHDFKVPGRPALGYDTYDYELCYEEIKEYIKEYDYHYNDKSSGASRGIIYIYPKKQV